MANDDDIIGPVPSIYVDHRIEIGESIVISGVINPLGNYSGVIPVRIKINDGSTNSYISLNTDSQGYYSTEYTFQTIGVHTITAMVGSDVSNSKTIYCYSNDTLTLNSDKNIIMAGERATITATLEENGVPVSGETVLFTAQKQGKTFTASNFSDIKNISTITNANNKVHIESFDTREIGLIVYDDVFGTYDHITRFTIENFETEDVGYICAVRNNTSVNSFIELSNGDFELITYYQHDIISVYKDGDFVGDINLGSASSTYQIGFYLSDTRMNLVDFNDAEYLGNNVTDSSGKATVSYLGRGTGDIYIKADCMFLTETYSIEDCIFVIPFNGNESRQQISGTTTIVDGEMRGGSAYLTDSRYLVNLQDNWVLTCDVKFGNANCDVQLVKQGVTSRDSNKVDVQYKQVFSVPSAKWYHFSQNCSYNVYYPVVWKNENGVLTITINGITTTIDSTTWTLAGTDSNMGIGVDNWGGTSYVKNVKLKPL